MPIRGRKRGGANVVIPEKDLKKLVSIAQTGAGQRRRRVRRGGSFWDDAWNGIKGVATTVAGPINDALKNSKVISNLGIPGVSAAAGMLGYGHRRRRGRVMHRGGAASDLVNGVSLLRI